MLRDSLDAFGEDRLFEKLWILKLIVDFQTNLYIAHRTNAWLLDRDVLVSKNDRAVLLASTPVRGVSGPTKVVAKCGIQALTLDAELRTVDGRRGDFFISESGNDLVIVARLKKDLRFSTDLSQLINKRSV